MGLGRCRLTVSVSVRVWVGVGGFSVQNACSNLERKSLCKQMVRLANIFWPQCHTTKKWMNPSENACFKTKYPPWCRTSETALMNPDERERMRSCPRKPLYCFFYVPVLENPVVRRSKTNEKENWSRHQVGSGWKEIRSKLHAPRSFAKTISKER